MIKPMLAQDIIDDLDKIKYPVLATPKLDGIRCLMVDGVAMSRNMRPLPNKYVQSKLAGLHGFDGELMVKGDFNDVQSAIMSVEGEPDFEYVVFDRFNINDGYRFRALDLCLDDMNRNQITNWSPRIKPLLPREIGNEGALLELLDEMINKGYEGICFRQPDSPYKHGRSTIKEGYLLKLKRFYDDEGELIEVVQAYHNTNEPTKDELGRTKRRNTKDAKEPTGLAGKVILRWQGQNVDVGFGKGFTNKDKKEFWDNREALAGKIYKFKYQELSKKGVPRFGKLIGERHPDDR